MAQRIKTDSEQDRKTRRRLRWVDLLLLILLAAMIVLSVFAWLYTNREQETEAGVSNFTVAGHVYFKQENGTTIEAQNVGGVVKVSSVPSDPMYLGKLRVDVKFTGYSPAYIRVRVLEQWTDNEDVLQAMSLIPYTIPSAGETRKLTNQTKGEWFDNRSDDLFYYYTAPVYSVKDQKDAKGDSPTALEIPLVTGVKESFLSTIPSSSIANLSLIVTVDAVQPNRIQQFWNREQIPQASGSVTESTTAS